MSVSICCTLISLCILKYDFSLYLINIPCIEKCSQIKALGFIEVNFKLSQFPVEVSVPEKMDKVQFPHTSEWLEYDLNFCDNFLYSPTKQTLQKLSL